MFDMNPESLCGKKQTACNYFVARKKRFCKMTVGKGRAYCGEHDHLGSEDTESEPKRRRIACPLDETHSCFEHKLQKHLKKCNSRPKKLPAYHDEAVESLSEDDVVKKRLCNLSDEDLLSFIDKIKKIYRENVPEVCKEILKHSSISDIQSSKHAAKHKTQISSIVSHMEKLNFLRNDTCFMEFGAGRGELTSAVVEATKDLSNCTYLLIDKASQRHKFDTKLRCGESEKVQRIKIDIQKLLIDKLEAVQSSKEVVIHSKHLCGAATDMSLKRTSELLDSASIKGVIIALCCHHRCSWTHYVGKKFLLDCELKPSEFNLLPSMSSWATCGPNLKNQVDEKKSDESRKNDDEKEEYVNRYVKLGLTHETRQEIGIMVKRILDTGRLLFMKQNGFELCELKEFVDESVTLENVLLICSKKE